MSSSDVTRQQGSVNGRDGEVQQDGPLWRAVTPGPTQVGYDDVTDGDILSATAQFMLDAAEPRR